MTGEFISILFVDDDKTILDTVPTNLKNSLAAQNIQTEIECAGTVEYAIQKLREQDYHLIIVDLKLEADGTSGNQIIDRILKTKVLPIIIFSAYPGDLDEKFSKHGLIHMSEKKKAEELISQISTWHKQGVFAFFSESGILASLLRKVLLDTMWNNVSKYWEHFQGVGSPEAIEQIVGRMAATIFYDVLSNSSEYTGRGGEVSIHHGEIYIFATPRKHLAPGDILKIDEKLFVVLSPACDLVPRSKKGPKARQIVLANCHDLKTFVVKNDTIQAQINALKNDNKKSDSCERIEKLMRQNWENDAGQYFYLPPFAGFHGGVVDFLDLRIEPYELRIEELVKVRLLTINREISAELATRFARYMIRLGQPAYEQEALIKSILQVFESA